jgi:DNA polymerase
VPKPELTPEQIRNQLQHRLEGYLQAGVQFVGPVEPLQLRTEEQNMSESLFSEVEEPNTNDPEQRRIALDVVRETVSKCERCPELCSTRTQTVFGVGPIGAEILFVGEAPGADEDRQGEPFVGAAGQMLNRIIAASELKREEIYICNILRCRPPGNRQPKPVEAKNCREFLEKTIELIAPKYIVTWGAVASQNLLETSKGIGKLRGTFHDFKGIPVLCTFHPASLLEGRSPENKKLVWDDMKMLLTKMGRPIPQGKK